MYITLSEARKHLNIDEFFKDDDDYIVSLIGVCEDAVAKRINRSLSLCVDPGTKTLEPSVRHAILLLLGTYYNQREATSTLQIREVPDTFGFLADLNKDYTII